MEKIEIPNEIYLKILPMAKESFPSLEKDLAISLWVGQLLLREANKEQTCDVRACDCSQC